MTLAARADHRLALLEAEMLYLCADMGGDVLARCVEVIETLDAQNPKAPACARLGDMATVLLFPRQALALDPTG